MRILSATFCLLFAMLLLETPRKLCGQESSEGHAGSSPTESESLLSPELTLDAVPNDDRGAAKRTDQVPAPDDSSPLNSAQLETELMLSAPVVTDPSLLQEVFEQPLVMVPEEGDTFFVQEAALPNALDASEGGTATSIDLTNSEGGQKTLSSVLMCEDKDDVEVRFGDWLGYNAVQSDVSWLVGNADELGIVSFESYPTLELGSDAAMTVGTSMHLLNGPVATDLPPRVYDMQLGFHFRHPSESGNFIADVRFSVGAFTDFEGSARKGIRFPGHAVGYFQWTPHFVTVLGAESLDRDDISVLPVGGFVWRVHEDLVAELIFPRPKLEVYLDKGEVDLSGG